MTKKEQELLSRHMNEVYCILRKAGEKSVTKVLSVGDKAIVMTFTISKKTINI